MQADTGSEPVPLVHGAAIMDLVTLPYAVRSGILDVSNKFPLLYGERVGA